jgi:2-polyprenyl-3-methyl-5-hydroxy-6-metoxy-1,4-benzoquinol methylase
MSKSEKEPAKPMSVNDIRPTELRQGQIAAYERDLQRLRQHLPDFVHVDCPACGIDTPSTAFEKYGFLFQRCRECRTLYMSPRPTPAIMASYYSNSENYRFWAEHIFPASEVKRREKIHRPMLDYILQMCRRHHTPLGRLVEIGPGFGTFSALAATSGNFEQVVAIERTPEMAQACRDRGVSVIENAVEEVTPEVIGLADVLVSFEVIEHLFDPSAFVRTVARILRPQGLLVLTCPNGEGFDTMMLGPHSGAVDSEHVNLFNPISLSRLLETVGFQVLDAQTPGRLDAELVREAVLVGTIDIGGDLFLRRVLIDEWNRLGEPFQLFLAANGLSGHLRVTARKQ